MIIKVDTKHSSRETAVGPESLRIAAAREQAARAAAWQEEVERNAAELVRERVEEEAARSRSPADRRRAARASIARAGPNGEHQA